jgi:signal peptidase I
MPDSLFFDLTSEVLRNGHRMRFRAEGKSMHPTIRDGEAITVEPVTPFDVKTGDIILYRSGRGVKAHRVLAIEGGRGQRSAINPRSSIHDPRSLPLRPRYSFLLRGDASSSCDDPVEPQQILGKVVSVERYGRRIILTSTKAKLVHNARVFAFRIARLTGLNKIFRPIRRTLKTLCTRPVETLGHIDS